MKIGYDAKRAFHNNRGLGNYSRDLLRVFYERALALNSYYLFNSKHKTNHYLNLEKNTFVIEPRSFLWKTFKSIWRSKHITKIIKEKKLDIYHGLSGEIPIGISKIKTKSIVTIHDLIFIRYPKLYRFFDRKIYYYKFKYAVNNCDHIIAISEQTKNDIINTFNVSRDKITVVYQNCNAVFKRDYSEKDKKVVSKKYNLPDKFVLNVGAIEERKNVLTVVKAIKDIDVSLIVVGNKKPYFENVENYIKENKLEHKVFFLSNVSQKELAIIYQLATIFCYPSIFEGFGIPIIEALYSKTPVITSEGSCFPEAGGPHSLYISPYDYKDLASKISLLLKDEVYRKNIVNLGYNFVQKFSDEQMYSEINAIYKSVLND